MPSTFSISKGILYEFLCGVYDSLRGFLQIFQYDNQMHISKSRSKGEEQRSLSRRRLQRRTPHPNSDEDGKVLRRVLSCCCLNGVVYLLSLFLFYYFLLPILSFVLELLLNEGLAQKLWSFVRPILVLAFEILWVLPVFFLSRIINTIWFQDIADSAYRQRQGRPQLLSSISILVADTLISCIIQILFLIQATLVRYLPFSLLAIFLHVFHMCLLNSLYSFEYRWCNMAWPLDRRLRYIEKNWPYFLGFGLPLSIFTAYPSSVPISGGIFAMLFPVFIISAIEAVPMSNNSGISINLFAGVVWLSNQMADIVFKSPVQTRSSIPANPSQSCR